MSERLWNLVQSQLPRESRRYELKFAHLAFLLLAALMLVGMPYEISPFQGLVAHDNPGGLLFLQILGTQIFILIALGSIFTADGVGERENGIHGLLLLGGCSPREWLAARLLVMAPAVVSTWLLAFPFLSLATTLGGVGWRQVWQAEGVLLSGFGMIVMVGLVQALTATRGRSDASWVLLSIEAFLWVPAGLVTSLQSWQVPIPAALVDAVLFAASCSPRRAVMAAVQNHLSLTQFTVACGLPLLIAGVSAMLFCARLFATPDDHPLAVGQAEPKPVRSIRCWDDALAWQIWFLTCQRMPLVWIKSLIYAAIAGLLAFSSIADWPLPRAGTVIVAAALVGLSLVGGAALASGCFTRELRERTLTVLALGPLGGADLYRGWSRGARRLMMPEYVLAAVALIATLSISPRHGAPLALASLLAILSLGPMFALWSLLPLSISSFVVGFVQLNMIGLVIFVSVQTARAVGPWGAPFVAGVLSWGLNRLCLWVLDSRLEARLQSISE